MDAVMNKKLRLRKSPGQCVRPTQAEIGNSNPPHKASHNTPHTSIYH